MKKNSNSPRLTPTKEQFSALNGAYKYFNRKLFKNLLPGCLLNFSSKKKSNGFLSPERWQKMGEKNENVHEISLTANTFRREAIDIFAILVHEMVHLWQYEFGSPSRNGYHNKEWANKMKDLGLMPSSTGGPGGMIVGQSMSHYIIKNGHFQLTFSTLSKKFILPFDSVSGEIVSSDKKQGQSQKAKSYRTSGKKSKYRCINCGFNVWGRPNLHINCGACKSKYLEI